MITSSRYYITLDDNASNIFDGATGKCVDSTPNWIAEGEGFEGRERRHTAQALNLAKLNNDDYASRRQFGEPRAEFAARSQ